MELGKQAKQLDLDKKTFILIDEVQYLDNPTNFLKYLYDQYRGKIKLIATGSSAFYLDRKFKDSLAGRKRIYYVFPLSFVEFLRFKGEDDLAQTDFNQLVLAQKEKIDFYYQEYLVFGGYPRVVLSALSEKESVLAEIVYSYIKKDVFEAGIKQDEVFFRLLKILAWQTGSLVNSFELASTLHVSKTAIDNYLYVMQKSFHLHLIRPFFKNMRKELSKMPKVYFLDLGLRNYLVKNFNSYGNRTDKGPLLENALFRQLLDQYDFEQIRFWRTTRQNEVDFIVNESRAFEVKVSPATFKANKYRLFLDNYPRMKFSLVTLGKDKAVIGDHQVFEVWEV